MDANTVALIAALVGSGGVLSLIGYLVSWRLGLRTATREEMTSTTEQLRALLAETRNFFEGRLEEQGKRLEACEDARGNLRAEQAATMKQLAQLQGLVAEQANEIRMLKARC